MFNFQKLAGWYAALRLCAPYFAEEAQRNFLRSFNLMNMRFAMQSKIRGPKFDLDDWLENDLIDRTDKYGKEGRRVILDRDVAAMTAGDPDCWLAKLERVS